MAAAMAPIAGPLALLPASNDGPAAPTAPHGGRGPAGGPGGKAPLVKAIRAKSPELRSVALAWIDRFKRNEDEALAELVSLILIVADVPWRPSVEGADLHNQDPSDVVQEIVAKVAVAAAEKGADFTQHWLVSREKGSVRVRENFPALWRELGAAAQPPHLLSGLLQRLREWVLNLADCQFRSVRHASALAGLHLVEGLGVQCRALEEFCGVAAVQAKDAQAQGAVVQMRSLSGELEHTRRLVHDLGAARDALGVQLLSKRSKDVDHEVRRCCFEATSRWAQVDSETFLGDRWMRYLHFGLCDRDAKARGAALTALLELLRGSPGKQIPALQSVAETMRPRVLARCHDVDAAVGAAAVRCGCALAELGALADADFDTIIDLVWDESVERSGEAATFVSRFVFTEDVLDYAGSNVQAGTLLPTGRDGGAAALRRVLMLLQFLDEYAEGHHDLAFRLASAFWRRASCLEDWEVFARLVMPGTEEAQLASGQQAALVHLAEAVARLATEDVAGGKPEVVQHAEAVLDRAARAFAQRIPALLEACQAEPAALRRATGLCRHVLKHCAAPRPGGDGGRLGHMASGAVGESAAVALKAAFLRQPDTEALEHIAEALAHLLDLSTSARPVIRELAEQLRAKYLEVAPLLSSQNAEGAAAEMEVPPADVLLAAAMRLRILAKAFDVSLCDLRNFCASALQLLDERAAAAEANSSAAISPQLAVTLLEMLVLIQTRHVAAYLQPEHLARCVMHDPVNQEELQLAPTLVQDLCTVATALLKADDSMQVRNAAFAAAVSLLTATSNMSRFASAAAGQAAAQPDGLLSMGEELQTCLSNHMGVLLTEANAVPVDVGISAGAPEPSSPKQTSAFSQLFSMIQHITMVASAKGMGEAAESAAVTDSDRVRLAVLASALLSGCRHSEVERSYLPALVLSQALSQREDMQEAAWFLLRRLRTESHWQPESAEAFFLILLQTVKLVHQDAGVDLARDLSLRLMQRVAVSKLSPTSQAGLIAALRRGAETALASEGCEGLLEALVPWVTKHIVEDELLQDLAVWADQQAAAHGGTDPDGAAAKAGLWVLSEACINTARHGQQVAGQPAGVAQQARELAADALEAAPARSPRDGAYGATAAFGRQKRRRVASASSAAAAADEPAPSTPVATVPATPSSEMYKRAPAQPRVLGPSP